MLKNQRMQLGNEIKEFLSKHGKSDVNSPTEWSSPDACLIETAATQLLSEIPTDEIRIPFSEWGSGGYKPYSDKKAKDWHDSLLSRIEKLIRSNESGMK